MAGLREVSAALYAARVDEKGRKKKTGKLCQCDACVRD